MRIAILTNFTEFNPGYSLTGIVQDQLAMLQKHGHECTVFVDHSFSSDVIGFQPAIIPGPKIGPLRDYDALADISDHHQVDALRIAASLEEHFADFDVALTHDWVFTGWNLPYALALTKVNLPKMLWLHWIHSIPPMPTRDWWDIRRYDCRHKLVFPNKTDQLLVAERFRGGLEHVRHIPHIKDLRTWFDFHPDTCRFIDRYPAIMQADIVQILPASVDRLKWKRVDVVMRILAAMKRMDRSVCLVIANQWATGRGQKEDVERYKTLAGEVGLIPDQDLIFSSDFGPEYEVGLPRHMVRELFQCSNLFIFPTDHESFGLVVPEAALAGCYMVLNKSLQQQIEISGGQALYFDFGSFTHHFQEPHPRYLDEVAKIILGRMARNEAIMTRTHFRQSLNMDRIYHHFYAPIMAEMAI